MNIFIIIIVIILGSIIGITANLPLGSDNDTLDSYLKAAKETSNTINEIIKYNEQILLEMVNRPRTIEIPATCLTKRDFIIDNNLELLILMERFTFILNQLPNLDHRILAIVKSMDAILEYSLSEEVENNHLNYINWLETLDNDGTINNMISSWIVSPTLDLSWFANLDNIWRTVLRPMSTVSVVVNYNSAY